MRGFLKWGAIAFGGVVMLALAGIVYVYIASEIALDRTYPLTQSKIHFAATPGAIAKGAHLVQIYSCNGCHGKDLSGIEFPDLPPGMVLWSPNLRLLAHSYADSDFDRAVRHGLRADKTNVIVMPSSVYAAMHDDELAAIVAYLRSLPARGEAHPRFVPGFIVRLGIVLGEFGPPREGFGERKNPLDLGPKYAAGRHMAQIACGECHGSDLKGGPATGPIPPRPDLDLVAAYERKDFLTFMRTGKAAGNRELPMMSDMARDHFSHFTDAEAGALYDYLAARGNALIARPTH
jgi:cytochrome c553